VIDVGLCFDDGRPDGGIIGASQHRREESGYPRPEFRATSPTIHFQTRFGIISTRPSLMHSPIRAGLSFRLTQELSGRYDREF
jgi:hypothetical protein